MNYLALWNKLKDKENPFRTWWAWIITGIMVAITGSAPLLLYMGLENLTGSSGGNPIGLGLLAMVGVALSQLCVFVAIIWMGYGVFRMFRSRHT